MADDVCSLSDDNQSFVRQDGTRIHLLFDTHQVPGEIGLGHIQQRIQNSPSSPYSLRQYVNALIPERSESVESIERQSLRLQQLSEAGEIDWVGWEALPENFNSQTEQNWILSNRRIMSQMGQYGVPESQIQSLLSYSWGPYFDDLTRGEAWARRLQSYAIDNDVAKAEWQQIMAESNRITEEYNFSPTNPMITPDNFEKIARAVDVVENHGARLTLRDISNFEASFPEELQEPVRRWIRLLYRQGQLNVIRDRNVARRLLEFPGNGAIVMGHSHRQGVLHFLQYYCNQEIQTAAGAIDNAPTISAF